MFWTIFTCFSPYLGVGRARGGGGLPRDWYTTCFMQFFTPGSSKIEVFKTYFFGIMTTQNDHPRYAKHVLGSFSVFFTRFGDWVPSGGSPKGLVHNLLMQFFTLGSSKNRSFQNSFFFDIVITLNDHPRHVQHVLARIFVVFTLFWGCVGWGRFSARWTCRRQEISCTGMRWKWVHVFLDIWHIHIHMAYTCFVAPAGSLQGRARV